MRLCWRKRLFKTTIFSDSKSTVINLLKEIIRLTNTKFIEENIYFTEKSKRNHNIKRTEVLLDGKLNNYIKTSFDMQLSSVYLQVNGIDKQFKLF